MLTSNYYIYLAVPHAFVLKNDLMQGTKAFCSGGDQALRSKDGYADFESFGRLNVLDLQVT